MYLHIFGPRALINHNEYKFYSWHGTDYRAKLGLRFPSICPRWFCFHPMRPLLPFSVEFAVAWLVARLSPCQNQHCHASPQSVQLVFCVICHRGSLVRFIVAACFLGLLDFLVWSCIFARFNRVGNIKILMNCVGMGKWWARVYYRPRTLYSSGFVDW